ncbi:MAG: LLM class flavin-dependent oxidoreductase, partial [Dehalococcoidia bacterium]
IQRPIPIWFGGGAEPVMKRIAKLADGWMPQFQPDERGYGLLEKMRGYAREYGRDPKKIGLEGRTAIKAAEESKWKDVADGWRRMGATHFSANTMGDGLKGPDQHIKRLEAFRRAVPA